MKEERKAARADKEKKQKDAQEKSRSLMANFFGKTKPHNQALPAKDSNQAAGPSSIENDFQKTFKPFVLKKDAELALHNWFLETKKRKPTILQESGATHDDAIIIDEDVSSECGPAEARTRMLPPNELVVGSTSGKCVDVWVTLHYNCNHRRATRCFSTAKTTVFDAYWKAQGTLPQDIQ